MNELTDDHIRRLLDALAGHEGGATIHLRDAGGARCGDNSVPLATVSDPAMVTCPACRLFASLPHISPCATELAAIHAAPPPPPPPARRRWQGRGELLAAGVGALGAGLLILTGALWIRGSGPSSEALDTPPAPTAEATPTAAPQVVTTPAPTAAPTPAPTPDIETVTVTTTVTSTSTVVAPPPPPAPVVVTQVNDNESGAAPTPAATPAATVTPTADPTAGATPAA